MALDAVIHREPLQMINPRRIAGTISKFVDFDKQFSFFVEDGDDWIQRHHLAGNLYEREDLEQIKKYSGQARVFFDIGSNVGNHAIFMAKVLQATKVYSFEANPFAADILEINVSLNRLSHVIDTRYIGMGLGEATGIFTISYPHWKNIGAARLIEAQSRQASAPNRSAAEGVKSEGASVVVCPLDSLNIGAEPDFIKIDVEGMEISVLKGMVETIRRFKPRMSIEVDNSNAGLFDEWLKENDYVKCESWGKYSSSDNILVAHRSGV